QDRAQEAREFVERTRTYVPRTPERAREPGGQEARKARLRGWPSLWLLSLGHSRESNPLPAGERKLCSSKKESKPRARSWIPAFAGMTSKDDDEQKSRRIPARAGRMRKTKARSQSQSRGLRYSASFASGEPGAGV